MADRYVKKPPVFEVVRFTEENVDEVVAFVSDFIEIDTSDDAPPVPDTIRGVLNVMLGGYIIKDADGRIFCVSPAIFEATYEKENSQ